METTFYNVTITIEADTPEEAYSVLCDKLGSDDEYGGDRGYATEWSTDTYWTGSGEVGTTDELWPE